MKKILISLLTFNVLCAEFSSMSTLGALFFFKRQAAVHNGGELVKFHNIFLKEFEENITMKGDWSYNQHYLNLLQARGVHELIKLFENSDPRKHGLHTDQRVLAVVQKGDSPAWQTTAYFYEGRFPESFAVYDTCGALPVCTQCTLNKASKFFYENFGKENPFNS
jgi:hypothetical protein